MQTPIVVPNDAYETFCAAHPHVQSVDTFADQCEELFETLHPELLFLKEKKTAYTQWRNATPPESTWVYYPWRNTIVKLLTKEHYARVRTSRNNPLITPDEQTAFANAVVGFAGLNVGNPGAVCIALEGGGRHMKFADFDTLSLANLNRFRGSVCDLGQEKVALTKRQVLEIDPYYTIDAYEKGLRHEDFGAFFLNPRIDILVEETDNLPLKIRAREFAKKHRIPVIMVTGNGAGNVLDVERYDTDPELPLLNGTVPTHVQEAIAQGIPKDPSSLPLYRDFMGDIHVPRLRDSFNMIGKSIAGIPQLSEASFIRGATISYAIRRIVVHDSLASGRYNVQLDAIV